MIYNEQIETRPMGDKRILDYLEAHSYHRCIDFGGVQRPFASKFVTTYVDMVDPADWQKRYPDMYDSHPEIWDSKLILGDCETDTVWPELEQDVSENGKYDFAISSHMLEHLLNPERFLEKLPLIADEGYIAIPNKVFELGRGREYSEEGLNRCKLIGYYRGAFPHKWIFTIKEKVLWGFPKLGALEMMDFGFEDKLGHYKPLDYGQLSFMWKGDIPVRIVKDSDIGFPDPQQAIELYRRELEEGL